MEQSVPIGDAALRLGLTLEELAEVAGRCIGWRGMLQARRAMNFLDARSESAGESYSRVVLDRIGIPTPIPQYEVWDQGVLIGRADFCWEEFRTLGELTASRSMDGFLGRARLPQMPSSRRSGERMPYAISAGRSSAGCGKTCTSLRSCGAGLSARSSGACEPPESADAPPSHSTLHLYVGRESTKWGVTKKAARQQGGAVPQPNNPWS
jgi:hypothetical protein